MFSQKIRTFAVCATVALAVAGCKKSDDNRLNFSNAIDSYYSGHPACLWQTPIKFPVQVDTSDADKTRGYDALVDQGLLQRTTAEKKVFIVASKQVTNYDLTDKGRSSWTADTSQPGYGNFCYGHRKVSSIDAWTPTNNQPGATTTVQYHYAIDGAPAWAANPETETAFPQVRAALAPAAGSNTLVLTSGGWQMNAPAAPANDPDANIVK
jgi:hypothetical protein